MEGRDVYFPDISDKASSDSSSRNEHGRLPYEYNLRNDRFNGKLAKEATADKVVTFYRNFKSQNPEIRLAISENRFRDFHQLVEDLSKIINLRDDEKYIHTSHGSIVRSLQEFEDGGVYFFGPPYAYNVNDSYQSRRQITPEQDESDNESDKKQRTTRYSPTFEEYNKYWMEPKKEKRTRKIKIISTVTTKPLPFVVDESQHKTMVYILKEISDLLLPKYGRIEKVCTRKGRTVTTYFQPPLAIYVTVENVYIKFELKDF